MGSVSFSCMLSFDRSKRGKCRWRRAAQIPNFVGIRRPTQPPMVRSIGSTTLTCFLMYQCRSPKPTQPRKKTKAKPREFMGNAMQQQVVLADVKANEGLNADMDRFVSASHGWLSFSNHCFIFFFLPNLLP